MKKILTSLSILCLLFVGFDNIDAEEKISDNGKNNGLYTQSQEYQNLKELIDEYSGEGQLYDKDGNPVSNPIRKSRRSRRSVERVASNYDLKYAIVDVYSNRTGHYIEYIDEATGLRGYLGGNNSGAYLGKDSQGRIRFRMSGVTGAILPQYTNQVAVYADSNNGLSGIYTSFYRIQEGKLWHYINQNNRANVYYRKVVGYPSDVPYLKENKNYTSYDGHYFYSDEHRMHDDYREGHYRNAVNANEPYYNYFQFLSHRAPSNYDGDSYNRYTNHIVGTNASKMKDLGQYYVEYSKKYGVNALMTYAVSCNESNYGRSSIAMNKNNLFGHAAYDSSPGSSANMYPNPQYSIYVHMSQFLSRGYLDPGDGRYHGSHLGDKGSGVGVRYASDPWWGETAAAIMYAIDEYSGKKDYKYHTIGIKENNDNINIRREPNTSSTIFYRTGSDRNYPFVILGSVKGTRVNGSDVWYKIQADPNLNNSRTDLDKDGKEYNPDGDYDSSRSYAYIHSSFVRVVNQGRQDVAPQPQPDLKPTPQPKPEPQPTPTPTPTPTYLKGDVNGNKEIDAADYLMIMDSILGKYKMSPEQKRNGDVNGNKEIDAADYLMIMDHILGKITIN